MKPDDKICYCFDVPMRKLVSFARRTKPARPSQMTECLGAGTGCGWCIPFLVKIAEDPDAFVLQDLTPEAYAANRKRYIKTEPKNTFDVCHAPAKQPSNDSTASIQRGVGHVQPLPWLQLLTISDPASPESEVGGHRPPNQPAETRTVGDAHLTAGLRRFTAATGGGRYALNALPSSAVCNLSGRSTFLELSS